MLVEVLVATLLVVVVKGSGFKVEYEVATIFVEVEHVEAGRTLKISDRMVLTPLS